MKKYAALLIFVLLAAFVLALTQPHSITRAQNSTLTLSQTPIVSPSPTGSYVVTGKPTISVDFINRVFAAYGSPAKGKGEALYTLGVKYGIDPAYALAFFLHESRFGTTGEATITLSLGNERCIQNRPCIDQSQGGYAQMESWEDGFEQWYRLILYGYVQGKVTIPLVGHSCTTIDQIIPVYAPSADHNNVAAYIAAIKSAVDTWRAGHILV